jgi:hypothetical protein
VGKDKSQWKREQGGRRVNIYFMPIDIQYVYTRLKSFTPFYTRRDIQMKGGGVISSGKNAFEAIKKPEP